VLVAAGVASLVQDSVTTLTVTELLNYGIYVSMAYYIVDGIHGWACSFLQLPRHGMHLYVETGHHVLAILGAILLLNLSRWMSEERVVWYMAGALLSDGSNLALVAFGEAAAAKSPYKNVAYYVFAATFFVLRILLLAGAVLLRLMLEPGVPIMAAAYCAILAVFQFCIFFVICRRVISMWRREKKPAMAAAAAMVETEDVNV